jgi:tRNA(Met) C34 N-acetyltransferase TmcA
MLSPTSAKANPLLQTAHADFSKEFAFQLSRHFKRLPYALVIRIIGSLSYPTLPQHSLTLIHQFSLNERPIELVERLLDALLLNTLSMNDSYRNMLTASEIHTLVSYVLQNQAIEDICSQVGLTGKKELKKVLVNCISKLLNDM